MLQSSVFRILRTIDFAISALAKETPTPSAPLSSLFVNLGVSKRNFR